MQTLAIASVYTACFVSFNSGIFLLPSESFLRIKLPSINTMITTNLIFAVLFMCCFQIYFIQNIIYVNTFLDYKEACT